MTLIQVPNTDLSVSHVGFGGNVFGWTADEQTSHRLISEFLDLGGNFIDTADVYSSWKPGNQGGESETIIGKWLAKTGRRDELVIATKVAMLETRKGLSAANIAAAVDDSLRRLQTDHIDIYYAHQDDQSVPLDETLLAFDKLVQAGKVRYIAASNYEYDRLAEANRISAELGLAKYVALQNRYSLVAREPYESDAARSVVDFNIAGFPYSTLGSGFLSGKYRPGVSTDSQRAGGVESMYATPENFVLLERLEQLAKHHSTSNTAVALAWLRAQDGVTAPLASGRTSEQLRELMVEVVLSPEDLSYLAG